MKYARLATTREILDSLTENNLTSGNFKNGIPLIYDKDKVYVEGKDGHTLVIAGTGSGKTQSVVLPFMRTTIKSGESMVIIDKKGEEYAKVKNELEASNYKTYIFNFENPKLSTCFNPLSLPYELYKKDNFDLAYNLLDEIGYYLFSDTNESDPYWTNVTIDFFKGISLYLFENAKEEEINLNSIYLIVNSLSDNEKSLKLMNSLSKTNSIYMLLTGTLNAPDDVKNSIISVFNYKIKAYVSRTNLSKLLSKSEFKFEEILKEKFAIVIVGDSLYANSLTSLLLNQLYEAIKYYGVKDMVNFILDNFDEIAPIKDFSNILNYARSIKIRFLCAIKSFTELKANYNDINILKLGFSNIIYLRSNDFSTMDEISIMCGETEKHERLISVQELKDMKIFEAIILLPRLLPYKTKLTPDYKLNPDSNIEVQFEERELPDIKTYEL